MSEGKAPKNSQMVALISENTRLTLGVAVLLIGFTVWLTVIFFQGDASAKDILELKAKQDVIGKIQIDVAVIKQQLLEINNKLPGVQNAELETGYRTIRRDRGR